MTQRLADKVAIVTGAAHGIGRAIAETFAEEGAAVLIADIDEDAGEDAAAEIRKHGRAASFVRVDVTDDSHVAHAIVLAAARNGRIDVLCNNAAYLTAWHDIEHANSEEWDKSYGVNLMGITGERASIGEHAGVLARRLKAATDKPVLMGFGVSTPEQAAEVAAVSDGVIVGTAVVRRILEGAAPDELHAYVSSLRAALDQT
jgi:NAD(P)-dependent dehydrogenase (short-subunit alcohol dehydrogenase family)